MASYKSLSGDVVMKTGDTADISVTDAVTNTSTTVQNLTHLTTGTPTAGIGVRVNYNAQNGSGTGVVLSLMRTVLTTVTAAAEVGAWRIGVRNAGALPAEGSEQLRLSGAGDLVITNSVSVGSGSATNIALLVDAARTIASADGATWNGIKLVGTVATLTGNTNITSSGGFNMVTVGAPGITAAQALTITNAATLSIGGAPIAQGSASITNAYALWAQGGPSRIDGGLSLNAANNTAIVSGASATWDGISVSAATCTVSGSTSITTATGFNATSFSAPSISAASALTITSAATVTILGPPTGTGAGPATITNAYALWVQGGGLSRVDGMVRIIQSGSYVAATSYTNPTLLLETNGTSALVLHNTDVTREAFFALDTGVGNIEVGSTSVPLGLIGSGSRRITINTLGVQIADASNFVLGTTTGTKIGTATAQKIGFWNSAPVVQGTVTGSRGGNAALASLLTLGASYGLWVDSTTA